MSTAELPLSEQGHIKARDLFSLDVFRSVDSVYSSPYLRAYSTAEKLRGHLIVDERLRERELGNPETLNAEFWNRQYENHDYKNTDGESLNDTKERMTSAIEDIISAMQDNNTVAIVSHAAAICAYLLNWCSIEVVDKQKKLRKIKYNGEVVLEGKIAMPSAFVLEFENEKIRKIKYIDKE